MLTQELRPKFFSEVVGGGINNDILLSVARNGGPSTFILAGQYGCGKSTSSRLFAKAVNCENLTNDICGKCDSCKLSFDNNPYYSEYDSSMFGNVESIRALRDELMFVPKGHKRVVNLDEAHLISKVAQSALLKVFEDAPRNIYYILTTTEVDSLLPTIVSRSMVLNFNTKSKQEIISNIETISKLNNFIVSDKVKETIYLRSKGHMRDVHKLLEKYLIVGEESFINSEESSYKSVAMFFINLFWFIKNKKASVEDTKTHKQNVFDSLDKMMRVPVTMLKDDYQNFFFDLVKKVFDQTYQCDKLVEIIASRVDKNSIMDVYKEATTSWMLDSFSDDIRCQTALLSLVQRFC